MKTAGLVVLMMAFASPAFATGVYREVWNPPEARATMPRRAGAARKLTVHRHVVAHAVKVHTRRAHASAPRLMAKQRHMPEVIPTNEPDTSEIPRQLTPEGNVLRVDSRGISVEVTR